MKIVFLYFSLFFFGYYNLNHKTNFITDKLYSLVYFVDCENCLLRILFYSFTIITFFFLGWGLNSKFLTFKPCEYL